LYVQKSSQSLLSKVTKCELEGPNSVLPAELARMPEMPSHQPDSGQKAKKTKELMDCTRKLIVVTIVQQCKDGVPPCGVFQKMAQTASVHWSTIMRLWKNFGTSNVNQALSMPTVKFSHHGNRGRQCIYIPGRGMIKCIRSIPVSQRRTLQDLSGILDVSLGTTHHLVKDGDIFCKHSSTLRPTLTEENKLLRIAWCCDHVDHTGHYSEMLDIIHVDEKWFNLMEATKSCYLTIEEEDPY